MERNKTLVMGIDTSRVSTGISNITQWITNLTRNPVNIVANLSSTLKRYKWVNGQLVEYARGGVIGSYANGGIVGKNGSYGKILSAAYGMVVPQTGQEYLIAAHKYEDIINTSQQRNLAEWIMGKANTRPGKDTAKAPIGTYIIENNFYIESLVTRKEADIVQISEGLFDMQEMSLRGKGYK